MRSTTMRRVVALAATAATFAGACGGDASLAEKSGGAATPLTLRLGSVAGQRVQSARYIDEFVRSVEEISGGSIDIEVAWQTIPWTIEAEQTLATMVSDGEVDLALVPTRVWDLLGVTSMRALQAPFLVDNLELLNDVVSSDLVEEMFAGLDALEVEGLALWPDALRHPFGFELPLLTAADFDGAQLRVPMSDTSFRLFHALGVEPVAMDLSGGVPPGMDGVESALNLGRDLPALGTFTANITFYPLVHALVANAELFESLSDDHRDAVRRGATDTIAYAIDENPTEHDLAEQYCADGGNVALADAADIAELAELAAPVLAELEGDDDTKRIIAEISELKRTATVDGATAAGPCGPVVEEVPGPAGSTTDVSEAAAGEPFPEGVYRVEITPADVDAADSLQCCMTGIWTLTVDRGAFQVSCRPLGQPAGEDCGSSGGYEGPLEAGSVSGGGGTVQFTGEADLLAELQGCQLPPSQTEPGHCFVVEPYSLTWRLDGETLYFSKPSSYIAEGFTIEPWTRIEDAGQPGANVPSFPEGVYRNPSTIDGVVTMEYRDGVWRRFHESGKLGCEATYVVEDGRIWLTFATDPALACGGIPGRRFLDAAWTLDGDDLTFVDINSDPNAVAEFSLPWTRIDDASAPDDEEETSTSDG